LSTGWRRQVRVDAGGGGGGGAGGAGLVETPLSYTRGMSNTSPLEDWRGVDVGQIQQQLRLSVSERVAVMVDAANRMIRMQGCAQQARKLTDS